MMDELELLKKDWQKKEQQLPKLSYGDIHKMTWKKSSSIVKWILIISILEVVLWNMLYFTPHFSEGMKFYENTLAERFFVPINIVYYGGVLYFIFLFYRRYREISVLDNSKNLMRKIIKTRRTVKHYVIFSLATILIFVGLLILGVYLDDGLIENFTELSEKTKNISREKLKTSLIISLITMGVGMTAVLGGIYYLLYGLLLRKLKANYKELRRLEI